MSGDLRLLSTNICWYPLCDLHSFLTVTLWLLASSFQREDSINLISIVSVGYHVTRWNRTFSVSLFRFWVHITFQYLGIVEGKRFKLYLSLTSFQCSDFFLSFLRVSDLPVVGVYQHVALADFCPKLKILLQISLTGNGILVRRVGGPIIRLFLFHYPVRSRYSIDLDFYRSTDYRLQCAGSWTFFPIPF